MGNEVEELLLSVGADLGRDPGAMQPFIDKLVKENWLDTADSLRALSNDQWENLRLPLRLVEAIRFRIGAETGSGVVAGKRSKRNVEEGGVTSPPQSNFLPPSSHRPGGSSSSSSSSNSSCSNSSSSSSSNSSNSRGTVIPTTTSHSGGGDSEDLASLMMASNRRQETSGGSDRTPPSDVSRHQNPALNAVVGKVAVPRSDAELSSVLSTHGSESNAAGMETPKGGGRDLTDVVYAAQPESCFPLQLEVAALQLQNELSEEELVESLPALFKLIDGVLAAPRNDLKRKIRTANKNFHQKVARHGAAVALLRAAGFEETEGGAYFELCTANVMRLTDAHHILAQLSKPLGIEEPALPHSTFNPYQSSIASTNVVASKLYTEASQRSVAEARTLQSATEERRRLVESGGGVDVAVPLRPRVFAMSKMGSLDDAVKVLNSCPAVEAAGEDNNNNNKTDPTAFLTAEDLSHIKESLSGGQGFASRAKKELEKLNKRPVFQQCVIRVAFPDKLVLQLHFKPSDKVWRVESEVEKFLSEEAKSLKWTLCDTPPLRRLSKNKTLYEECLVPGAMLRFTVPHENGVPPKVSSYLSRDFLAQSRKAEGEF